MQKLFFLNNPKAEATASNSIQLRFKLVQTGKYKVKGLGISCSLKDWNQSSQEVESSNEESEKYNGRLRFIRTQIEDIEKVRVVTEKDIDAIVKASIEGITLKKLSEKCQTLYEMLKTHSERINKGDYSDSYKRDFKTALTLLEDVESNLGYKITVSLMNESILAVQNSIVDYLKVKERNGKTGLKDTSIVLFLTHLNAAINYDNELNNRETVTFSKKYKKAVVRRQIIALTSEEIKTLYNFAFNPQPIGHPKPLKSELRKIKYFLFRCFCGMRVADMHPENINQYQLKKDAKSFTYLQRKGKKKVTVSIIDSKLWDIAESLEWKFPTMETDSKVVSHSALEKAVIRKWCKILFKDDMRKIEHQQGSKRHYTDLGDEITTHTARKSHAHLLYSLTKDIGRVKKELGHTNIETTMRYLDFYLDNDSTDLTKIALGF